MANQDLSRYSSRNSLPLSEAVNQLFRDAFTTPFAGLEAASRLAATMNLYDTDDSYILQVPLPGIQLDQLNVTVRENVVTLQGSTEISTPEGARNVYTGTMSGQFREMVQLPGEVDADRANATYDDGVLTLTLPKAASARAREIRVNTRGDGQQRQQRQNASREGQSQQDQGQTH